MKKNERGEIFLGFVIAITVLMTAVAAGMKKHDPTDHVAYLPPYNENVELAPIMTEEDHILLQMGDPEGKITAK